MLKRSVRLPIALLALSILGGVVLLTIDATAVADDPTAMPALRSDIRVALATMAVIMSVWIALVLVLEAHRKLDGDVEALRTLITDSIAGVSDRLQDITHPLARPRLHVASTGTVVGTAAVVMGASDPPGPVPTNVVSFEAGRRVGRLESGRDG